MPKTGKSAQATVDKTLIIRHVPPALHKRIRTEAERRRIHMNTLALEMLEMASTGGVVDRLEAAVDKLEQHAG